MRSDQDTDLIQCLEDQIILIAGGDGDAAILLERTAKGPDEDAFLGQAVAQGRLGFEEQEVGLGWQRAVAPRFQRLVHPALFCPDDFDILPGDLTIGRALSPAS